MTLSVKVQLVLIMSTDGDVVSQMQLLTKTVIPANGSQCHLHCDDSCRCLATPDTAAWQAHAQLT